MEILLSGGKKIDAVWNGHVIHTDQPTNGGEGSAPTPFDLFLASIGTCVGIFVKGFCDQRGLPSEGIKLVQEMEVNPSTHLISKIRIKILVPPSFPEKYKDALVNVANLCKVKQHIVHPPQFEVFAETV